MKNKEEHVKHRQGRCHQCKTSYVWIHVKGLKVTDVPCPVCGFLLRSESNQFKGPIFPLWISPKNSEKLAEYFKDFTSIKDLSKK